jgi:hypothetical protein
VRCGRIYLSLHKTTVIYFVVCLLTSVIFALIVSFHDYLPEHPPAYILLAEDKLKPQYTAERVLKTKEDVNIYRLLNMGTTCDPAQVALDGKAPSTGKIQKYNGFIPLFADLPPPIA